MRKVNLARLEISSDLPLILADRQDLTELPPNLERPILDVARCRSLRALPSGLRVGRLTARECTALAELPAGMDCYDVDLSQTAIERLPDDLRVRTRLDLSGCAQLTQLPAGLKVGTLLLRDCTALRQLPPGLEVSFLDLSGCTALESLPDDLDLSVGRLQVRDCVRLAALPPRIGPLAQLDVAGCARLQELPEALVVTSWLDLGETPLLRLPPGVAAAQLRWRGVPIDERIAFRPEEIRADEVLAETNAELRRVLLARMGFERFLVEARAEVLDEDRDPGGPRRLMRVAIAGDEDLVCLSVLCPSTGRHYLLRVPPTTRLCHAAAAWLAGYDQPDHYRPLVET